MLRGGFGTPSPPSPPNRGFGTPSPSTSTNKKKPNKLKIPTQGTPLQSQNRESVEAAAVTLSELGDYDRAASLLEKLSKVKYELKDYEGSVAAYKNAAS
ncbi:hypothetical protein FRX31_013496, partial [Thalictrum thalictroides]